MISQGLAVAEMSDVFPYEHRALALLKQEHSISLDVLIERVADEALRAEVVAGGWAVDVGLWGPVVFRREASAAIRGMLGRTLALECEGPLLAVPVG